MARVRIRLNQAAFELARLCPDLLRNRASRDHGSLPTIVRMSLAGSPIFVLRIQTQFEDQPSGLASAVVAWAATERSPAGLHSCWLS